MSFSILKQDQFLGGLSKEESTIGYHKFKSQRTKKIILGGGGEGSESELQNKEVFERKAPSIT